MPKGFPRGLVEAPWGTLGRPWGSLGVPWEVLGGPRGGLEVPKGGEGELTILQGDFKETSMDFKGLQGSTFGSPGPPRRRPLAHDLSILIITTESLAGSNTPLGRWPGELINELI